MRFRGAESPDLVTDESKSKSSCDVYGSGILCGEPRAPYERYTFNAKVPVFSHDYDYILVGRVLFQRDQEWILYMHPPFSAILCIVQNPHRYMFVLRTPEASQ